jgi:hypothetical protein
MPDSKQMALGSQFFFEGSDEKEERVQGIEHVRVIDASADGTCEDECK